MHRWRERSRRLFRHPGDALLLAEVALGSRIVSALLRRVGVERTVRFVRPRARPSVVPGALESRRAAVLATLADPLTSRWTKGACLERSILLYRLLNRAGAPVDLVIGLRYRGGAVEGHAWLTADGLPVLERVDPTAEYRPTLRFPSPLTEETRGDAASWRPMQPDETP